MFMMDESAGNVTKIVDINCIIRLGPLPESSRSAGKWTKIKMMVAAVIGVT